VWQAVPDLLLFRRYSCAICIGLPDAFISVSIVEALGKQLTNPGEMVRGYAAIAIGYLTFNPIAKRQTLNMYALAGFVFVSPHRLNEMRTVPIDVSVAGCVCLRCDFAV